MKRSILTSVIIFLVLTAGAQVKQEVIASAGGYDVVGSGSDALSISWTLGETIIPTFSNGDLTLTHGFQQQLIITAIEENIDVLVNIKVYPNPASDLLNIRFEEPLDGKVDLTILDSQGRLIMQDRVEAATVDKQINLQGVPAGIYYLRLIKGKLINVYKVVKL
jgi:hypothetical protein